MVELCEKDACTGCEACRNICPQGCITMVEDQEGFLSPQIDQSQCIECNRCRNICPVLAQPPSVFQRSQAPQVYAAWIKDDAIRRQSSSGGIFSAIAESVLRGGGVVFGAAFDERMHLRHIAVETIEDLDQLRRSKYVQSQIGDTFQQVRQYLDQGRQVFFVGAPCQIAGLNLFLGEDKENLLTADFICQGVPSPKVFSKYLQYIEDTDKCKIQDIDFRDKRKGWSSTTFVTIKLSNNREKILSGKKNGYMYGFYKNIILRKPCYKCIFRVMPRQADYTIADFWGLEDKYPTESYKGISCLLVNSDKGQTHLQQWAEQVCLFVNLFERVAKKNKNILGSIKMPAQREQFFKDFNELPFSALIKKHLLSPLRIRIRAYIKSHVDLRIVLLVKKIKGYLSLLLS